MLPKILFSYIASGLLIVGGFFFYPGPDIKRPTKCQQLAVVSLLTAVISNE